jgi:hypothetical protein
VSVVFVRICSALLKDTRLGELGPLGPLGDVLIEVDCEQ